MDLRIRSQDRRILQKVDNVFLDANYDNKRICSYDNDSKTELGTYKTKERALEVLDEIQETICLDEFNYENEEKTVYQDCYRYKSNIMAVYEMPKE